ncbi:hypothetical protein pb186bvf_007346 [Paramecium bursaria]
MIRTIKEKIVDLQDENTKLTTKIVRCRKVLFQKQAVVDELDKIIQEGSETDTSVSTQTSYKVKELPKGMDRIRELYKSICKCGETQSLFNGFCLKCIQEMKDKYKEACKDYFPIQEQYDKLYSKNINTKVKMAQMLSKIEKIRAKIEQGDFQETDPEIKLLQDEILFLRKKIKFATDDIETYRSNFNRFLDEKNIQQETLESRIFQKKEKVSILELQISKLRGECEELTKTLQEKQQEFEKLV